MKAGEGDEDEEGEKDEKSEESNFVCVQSSLSRCTGRLGSSGVRNVRNGK